MIDLNDLTSAERWQLILSLIAIIVGLWVVALHVAPKIDRPKPVPTVDRRVG